MRRHYLVALALFVAAALYFAQGITSTLELTDEGCIIYPIWRVAEGAIPYRDFRQLYGPSLFFVNAALLRLFGPDLLVIRVALVVLKALVALLVYLLARRVARWPFALIAYALCVVVWGAPWWILNSPYASHWAIALNLAALLTFVSLPHRPRTAALLAGLCFGLATTFKQTTGIFGFTSLLLFLAYEEGGTSPGVAHTTRTASMVRLLVPLGAAGLFAVYLRPHLTSWSTLTLVAPIAATVILPAIVSLRARASWHMSALTFSSIGMALPLLAYGAFYLGNGSLTALADNLAYGLPQRISRFVPLPAWGVHRLDWFSPNDPAGPDFRTLIAGLVVVAAFSGIRLWRKADAVRRPQHLGYGLAMAVSLLATAAWLRDVVQVGGVVHYLENGEWLGEVLRLFFWIPLLLVWVSFSSPVRMRDANKGPRAALRLLHVHAAVGLLQLYPTADIWHVLMILPIYLPLVAYEIGQGAAGDATRSLRYPSTILSATVLVWLTLPFVHALVSARATRAAYAETFSRATGIWNRDPRFSEAVALVKYLRAATSPEQPLLVMSNQPGIYFLAGRVSALDDEEYTLYLIGTELISESDAREMLDQDQIVARLETARPVVIDAADSPASARFMETLPQVAQYIRSHYRLANVIGDYRVLQWQ